MKYKMLVSDFDNTLLRTDHTISEQTWQAIREFESRGGKFVISTGRMLSTIIKKVREFGLTGEIIAFQGGVVADIETGDVILKKYVKEEDALELLQDVCNAGYYVQIYNGGDYFVNRYTERSRWYALVNKLEPFVIGDDVIGYIKKNNISLDKIVFAIDDDRSITDYATVEAVIKEYAKKYEGRFVFNSSNTMMIEAVSVGCTKGEAVQFVAERNGIKREEVICMGDALNDASMVLWAGKGIAVANATHDLKELADEVTVSCDEDAVGTIIKKYCLED